MLGFSTSKEEEWSATELLKHLVEDKDEGRKTALVKLQILVSRESSCDDLVDSLLHSDGLAILLQSLELHDDDTSQVAALTIFENITSGTKEQSQAVVNVGAIIPFIQLIDSNCLKKSEQALICAGNLACEDSFNRKILYENGGLNAVLRFLKRKDLEPHHINSGVWAFSNMCRSRTLISLKDIEDCAITIKSLIKTDDCEILRNLCAAIAYLTDGPNDRIQTFLNNRVCHYVIKLVHHGDPLVAFSALRAVSNLLSGTDEQIEAMIEEGVVPALAHVLIKHKERRVIKEACMSLSNITAGSQAEIRKVVEADLVPELIRIGRRAPPEVGSEAIWAIGNAVVGSGHELIKEFLSPECMKVLSHGLTAENPALVALSMQAIRNFLWCGDFAANPSFDVSLWDSKNDEDFWEHAEWLSACKGFYRLAKLREHPDSDISSSALSLLKVLIENPYADYSDARDEHTDSSDDEDNLV